MISLFDEYYVALFMVRGSYTLTIHQWLYSLSHRGEDSNQWKRRTMALTSVNQPLGKTRKFAQFLFNLSPRLCVIARSVPWIYTGLAQHSLNHKTYTSTSLCFSRSMSDSKADRLAAYPLGRDSQASIRQVLLSYTFYES